MTRSSAQKLGLNMLILVVALGALVLCVLSTTVIDSDSIGRVWIGAGTILLLLFICFWILMTALQLLEVCGNFVQKRRLAKGK